MKTCFFDVRPIYSKEAMEMVIKYHYSHRVVGARHCFGIFNSDVLLGCVVYSQPASYTLCKGVCGEFYKNNVLELSRLVIVGKERNLASKLIGGSLKILKSEYIKSSSVKELQGVVVVSYADCNEHVGHVGYVYQATNWIYTGKGSAEPIWVHPETNEIVSYTRRHIDLKAKSLGLDWTQLVKKPQSGKHRYVTFAGSQQFKEKAYVALRYNEQPYPKGNSRRHEPSEAIVENKLF